MLVQLGQSLLKKINNLKKYAKKENSKKRSRTKN